MAKQSLQIDNPLLPKDDMFTKDIKESLEKTKQKKTTAPVEEKKKPKFRKVRLKYESCCGCGCEEYELIRKVPYDSKLKNGDYVKKRIYTL